MSAAAERREMIALPDETYVEAWVGYRQWNMLIGNGRVRLHPISAPIVNGATGTALRRRSRGCWEPGQILTAACLCRAHDVDPRCGFHAWRSPPRVTLLRPHVVWGEAYLWGDVEIHEKGYRAQHAMVAALYVFAGMDERSARMIELAALQYAVPTVVPDLQVVQRDISSRL